MVNTVVSYREGWAKLLIHVNMVEVSTHGVFSCHTLIDKGLTQRKARAAWFTKLAHDVYSTMTPNSHRTARQMNVKVNVCLIVNSSMSHTHCYDTSTIHDLPAWHTVEL